jgi:hypothetical protein
MAWRPTPRSGYPDRMTDSVSQHPIVHEDVRAAVAAAIPPRRVPLPKRLFWSAVLLLLRFPRGREWLASRQRR